MSQEPTTGGHSAALSPDDDGDDGGVEPIERHRRTPQDDPDGIEEEGERERVGADGWRAVDTDVSVSLFNVCFTAAGPVAAGGDGKVLHRDPETGAWRVIIEAGPSVTFNDIHDVDVTDDGERFWFVGDSGIIGAFDVKTGRKYDFSAPMEKTSTWESIAVTGEKGEERVIYANGSGELLDAEMDEHGFPDWGAVRKPGRGSTMPGIDFDSDGTAYAADTTGKAYQQERDAEERSSSGNRTQSGDGDWETIGVRNAQVNFHDIDCDDGHLLIAGDDGVLYRFDRFADNWTPIRAGDGTIYSIDQHEGRRGAASADGRVFEPEAMVGWSERPTEVAEDLYGIAFGPRFDIAVGAAGTIVERHHSDGASQFEDEPERPAERSKRRRERRRRQREQRTGERSSGQTGDERPAERSRKRRERRRKQREKRQRERHGSDRSAEERPAERSRKRRERRRERRETTVSAEKSDQGGDDGDEPFW
ncbi:hypothetical protein JCM30237_29670 [Halolamina litorea]|uniref:Uncharacterized protein n=1 Tax=Halolamina litorea TaxID=1515593 RepID=A0ABD6BT85_9EURY|nr:hypothetical protein [Halolamina litorea]